MQGFPLLSKLSKRPGVSLFIFQGFHDNVQINHHFLQYIPGRLVSLLSRGHLCTSNLWILLKQAMFLKCSLQSKQFQSVTANCERGSSIKPQGKLGLGTNHAQQLRCFLQLLSLRGTLFTSLLFDQKVFYICVFRIKFCTIGVPTTPSLQT